MSAIVGRFATETNVEARPFHVKVAKLLFNGGGQFASRLLSCIR